MHGVRHDSRSSRFTPTEVGCLGKVTRSVVTGCRTRTHTHYCVTLFRTHPCVSHGSLDVLCSTGPLLRFNLDFPLHSLYVFM